MPGRGHQKRKRPLPVAGVDGAWVCTEAACNGFINYRENQSCFRCASKARMEERRAAQAAGDARPPACRNPNASESASASVDRLSERLSGEASIAEAAPAPAPPREARERPVGKNNTVTLRRPDPSLALGIALARDEGDVLYIRAMASGSLGAESGALRCGDVVVAVNGAPPPPPPAELVPPSHVGDVVLTLGGATLTMKALPAGADAASVRALLPPETEAPLRQRNGLRVHAERSECDATFEFARDAHRAWHKLPPALQGAARVHGAPSGRIDAGVAVPYDTGRVIGQANPKLKAVCERLPMGGYEGRIELFEPREADGGRLARAIAELRRTGTVGGAGGGGGGRVALGFDTETRPVFQKGQPQNPICLVQLATDELACLFRLARGVPLLPALADLLADASVLKVGVDAPKELDALAVRDADADGGGHVARGGVELRGAVAWEGSLVVGVKGCAAAFVGVSVSKKMQTSNWEAPQLSGPQQRYAATDAWVCFRAYRACHDADELAARRAALPELFCAPGELLHELAP